MGRCLGARPPWPRCGVPVSAPPRQTGSVRRTLCQLQYRYTFRLDARYRYPYRLLSLLSAVPNRTRRASQVMTFTAFLFWGLLPLLLVVAVVDLLTMSQPRRVQLLRRSGMTQAAIADRLQISRYRVRQALA